MDRLETLKQRREKLILANLKHHYTQGYKIQKYFDLMVRIRTEMIQLESIKRNAMQGFLNPQNCMTMQKLFEICKPKILKV